VLGTRGIGPQRPAVFRSDAGMQETSADRGIAPLVNKICVWPPILKVLKGQATHANCKQRFHLLLR